MFEEAWVTGDASAERRFRQLYEMYGAHVFAYFKRRTDDPHDCAADTFLVAWRRIDEVPDGDQALAWLYGVSRRVLANHRRRDGRFQRLRVRLTGLGETREPDPESILVRRAEGDVLLSALGSLSLADQELLRLSTWEELPHAEIGEQLGCSAHAVDQRLHRAIRRLARELGGTGLEYTGTKPTVTGSRGETR